MYFLNFFQKTSANIEKNVLILDDCIYLFFVCTDKASGAWPDNKVKCTKMFDACQSKLGLNITDPDSINLIENTQEIDPPLEGGNEIPETTNPADEETSQVT